MISSNNGGKEDTFLSAEGILLKKNLTYLKKSSTLDKVFGISQIREHCFIIWGEMWLVHAGFVLPVESYVSWSCSGNWKEKVKFKLAPMFFSIQFWFFLVFNVTKQISQFLTLFLSVNWSFLLEVIVGCWKYEKQFLRPLDVCHERILSY